MKISDLSVGDWVMVDGEDWKVSAINEDSVGLRVDSDYAVAEISECDGILLTPEILEKNGFKKNGEYNEWNIGEWNERPFIGVSLDLQSMRIISLGTDIFVVHQVVCVHQLQHALRLAGIEKEIEL